MRKAFVSMLLAFLPGLCLAQNESATLSGRVSDPTGAAVAGAEVVLTNVETNVEQRTKTNSAGLYVFTGVRPGAYRVAAGSPGFKTLIKENLTLHVQDEIAENFSLSLGSVAETVTVNANDLHINTTDASVSTVVDQTYVRNMPLNGRSFQDLILLTPGIVTQTPQNTGQLGARGEFSVNGQRGESNYYTVDGVSANVGAVAGSSMTDGAGASGSVAAATALGTTQALVSVDDLQEFRVQTSTYSAEYGRNPGGQFAFETKSGTNQWHGTAYEYLRNDYFDANDWFNDYLGVREPTLRQNDFGGTLGGPIRIPHLYNGKDKTFFFFSYEGLRLIQPQPATTKYVPSLCLRGDTASCSSGETPAPSALQPVLNAFAVPNRPEVLSSGQPTGAAPFIASWSNPNSIDSSSIRFDHAVGDKLRLFFRFSDARSSSASRTAAPTPSIQTTSAYIFRTYTAGASSLFPGSVSNEVRFNYSSNYATSRDVIGSFGGNTPVNLGQLTGIGTDVVFMVMGGQVVQLDQQQTSGAQRQWNLVETTNLSRGRHQFKFGMDYRRLAPLKSQTALVEFDYIATSSVEGNSPDAVTTEAVAPAYPLFTNFSAFAQDEWKMLPRLSLSLGLRWEVNPAPGVTQELKGYTLQGSSPATWTVAPQGTPLWRTTWYNFAPRLGAAYVVRDAAEWETVIRGGGGVFFDTGQQAGSSSFSGEGFMALKDLADPSTGLYPPFPGTGMTSVPAIVNPPQPPYDPFGTFGFAPHLQLPYTLQWNGSIEQALGRSQALSVSYVGSHSSRLLVKRIVFSPLKPDGTPVNPNGRRFQIWENGLTGDYDSLQLQFQRRFSRGLTALASYTWSHCVDYGSEDYNLAFVRANCDMDVRHNFSGAFSYDLRNVGHTRFASAVLHHWGLDDRFTARTSFPVSLGGQLILDPATHQQLFAGLDLVPNQPVYIYGSQCASVYAALFNSVLGCPGGRAINPNAFTNVPVDANGNPTRLGTAPRNFARGFGAWQMDLAVRREFPIRERLKLQFRAEAFNIFNHPNLGTIDSNLGSATFGQATATLAQSLGILSPLYQMGGPRSMQFALKLTF